MFVLVLDLCRFLAIATATVRVDNANGSVVVLIMMTHVSNSAFIYYCECKKCKKTSKIVCLQKAGNNAEPEIHGKMMERSGGKQKKRRSRERRERERARLAQQEAQVLCATQQRSILKIEHRKCT